MVPKYSVLFYKCDLEKTYDAIRGYLHYGIKIFWFGTPRDIDRLKGDFKPFSDAFFLQTFDITEIENDKPMPPAYIIDGEDIADDEAKKALIERLEQSIYAFNAAQYRVEHSAADSNIVVRASAGTGKTTVMIDRILYLMHMVPGLSMSDIYMITFTNEATDQMNDRLQAMLLRKYSLTKNKRYLSWLEQQSQMHISTIDSLAYDLFKRFGSSVGFGRDLQIMPLEKERKDILKDVLSDSLKDDKAINDQIGMTYSEAWKLIDRYWSEMTRKGYTVSDVLERDWGDESGEPKIENFQNIMKSVLKAFEDGYRQLKLDENGISINDLFFDFGHYLLDDRLNCDGLDMKYLFVDEFQDTDATQIRTFARLVQAVGAGLFVVGDVKQSIYAFKGATDEAFDILDEEMKGKLTYFSLLNNYRTCSNLMRSMERYFFKWSDMGLLRYDEAVRPFNSDTGSMDMYLIENKDEIPGTTLKVIEEALQELEVDVRTGRKKVNEKTKVAVLFRGNGRAYEVAEMCKAHGMTVVLSSDRPFFLSQAVRDIYALIASYIFVDDPIYIYNYLMTPYAKYEGVISVSEMERYHGDKKGLLKYLGQFLSMTKWVEYQVRFRTEPVLSVLKEIIENENVIENFIALDKVRMYGDSWTEPKKNRQAYIDARSYQLNLDKLMDMIQQRMEGEFATLYDLYVYLSLMIATNRDDMEPDVDMEDDYTSVYIMTVHKSKGLEFDTVIMPAMNHGLEPDERTEILFDKKHVSWLYKRRGDDKIKSLYYDEMKKEANKKGVAEETRMLYVAMTRAVNRIFLLVNNWTTYTSWSTLIREVGLINE